MLTFTVNGRGCGVYSKLRLSNDIKSYVTYLIANSKAEIHFFSNIEIGHELSNPHLHTQIWSDDLEAVRVVYDKVIKKFSLTKKHCSLSIPTGPKELVHPSRSTLIAWSTKLGPLNQVHSLDIKNRTTQKALKKVVDHFKKKCLDRLSVPQQQSNFYNYVIKDYSKDLDDNTVWNLEQTKIRMRRTLGLKLRFSSKSKSKYTKVMYRMVYRAFGILREFADKFLDLVTSTLFVKKETIEDILYSKKFMKSFSISSFITIKNKGLLNIGLILDFIFSGRFFVFSGKIEILFYSPSCDPPILDMGQVGLDGM